MPTDPDRPPGPIPEAYVWASAARLANPELFNAVAFYYWAAVKHGEIDPPCNPMAPSLRRGM